MASKAAASAVFRKFSALEPRVLAAEKRRVLLSQPLSHEESELFDMPIGEWLTVKRESLAGYKCSLTPVRVTPPSTNNIIVAHNGAVTPLAVDAIVNAANNVLLGGGGVDGAIHAAAGPLLRRECALYSGCPTGECIVTKGYNLPARYVIHTVGPIGEVPDMLRRCYQNVLHIAKDNGLRSIGLCGISTGIYGYPLQAAAKIAVEEVTAFLDAHPTSLDLVCFSCFRLEERAVLEAELTRQRGSL